MTAHKSRTKGKPKGKPASATDTQSLPGHHVRLGVKEPLRLDCGVEISDFPVAYQTYGELNADKSNVILVCHALTGDQFLAEPHPITEKEGWWDLIVGPGKTIDTNQYFIICVNILGGCMGTYGPKETGIEKLFAVTGGSMGGMQVLEWASMYPERTFTAIPIAAAAHHTAQNIAFHEVGRQAIMADPDWCDGDYLNQGKRPTQGLAVARMAAHITYLSDQSLHQKFGRRLQDRDAITYGFDAEFQVESYLRHQGITFVDRFDANSYLYITRAMDYFDMAAKHGGNLADAFKDTPVRFCVISFTGDWLYPTEENRRIVHALNSVAANVSFAEVESDKGHDAFLLDEPNLQKVLKGFLDGAAENLTAAAGKK
jgi:homoserine O-acetyltransferase